MACREIFRLAAMLEEAEIPFEFYTCRTHKGARSGLLEYSVNDTVYYSAEQQDGRAMIFTDEAQGSITTHMSTLDTFKVIANHWVMSGGNKNESKNI